MGYWHAGKHPHPRRIHEKINILNLAWVEHKPSRHSREVQIRHLDVMRRHPALFPELYFVGRAYDHRAQLAVAGADVKRFRVQDCDRALGQRVVVREVVRGGVEGFEELLFGEVASVEQPQRIMVGPPRELVPVLHIAPECYSLGSD